MKKQNIAILVNRMTGAGPARMASNLSLHLSDDKYNKTVVIYDGESSTYQVNGNVINLNTKRSKNPVKRFMNTISRIRTLKRIKREHNIQTTISLLPNPNLVNILSKVKDKVIISERSFMSKELKGLYGYIYKNVFKYIYGKSDLVIAVSKVVKQDLITNFGINKDKIKVIYNFYDIDKIKSLSREPLKSVEKEMFDYPTIITAGRLSDQKGQWHLIRAFKKVKREIPEAKLIILGDGDLEQYLKRLATNIGLEQDVHFLGFQENPFKYIAKADVYTFPSLYEGFPNALSEAMVCGLPIISSDCQSGPREVLCPSLDIEAPSITNITHAEYGILIPTCDGKKYNSEKDLTVEENQLAKSMIELLTDRLLHQKYKVQSTARIKEFHVNNIIGEWDKVIQID